MKKRERLRGRGCLTRRLFEREYQNLRERQILTEFRLFDSLREMSRDLPSPHRKRSFRKREMVSRERERRER